jgi:hypothetical protein
MTPNQSAEFWPALWLGVFVGRQACKYAENNLHCFGWCGCDSIALLAIGIRDQTVWRDISVGNDRSEPDWLFSNWRHVVSN